MGSKKWGFEITGFKPDGDEYYSERSLTPEQCEQLCEQLTDEGYEEIEAIVSLTGMPYWNDGCTFDDAFDTSDDGEVDDYHVKFTGFIFGGENKP